MGIRMGMLRLMMRIEIASRMKMSILVLLVDDDDDDAVNKDNDDKSDCGGDVGVNIDDVKDN